jgi:hypothetical protein
VQLPVRHPNVSFKILQSYLSVCCFAS